MNDAEKKSGERPLGIPPQQVAGKTMKALVLKQYNKLCYEDMPDPAVGPEEVRVAVAHGLGNARKLMDRLSERKAGYHFIEIMACPGGCVAGGGQPIPVNDEIRRLRAQALYQEDKNLKIRKSHENPSITKIYQEFLIEPLGEKSHHLLHTRYTARGRYKEKSG